MVNISSKVLRLACLNKEGRTREAMSRGIEIRRWWILRDGGFLSFFFFATLSFSWNFSRSYDRIVTIEHVVRGAFTWPFDLDF